LSCDVRSAVENRYRKGPDKTTRPVPGEGLETTTLNNFCEELRRKSAGGEVLSKAETVLESSIRKSGKQHRTSGESGKEKRRKKLASRREQGHRCLRSLRKL